MILHDLDNVDHRLVEALAVDGRATVTSLAQLVGLSGPSVHERLRKLEAAGAIRGYAALVDPDAVGAGVAAFVALNLGPGLADKERIDVALAREPRVLEVHEVAGEDCYLVKLRVGSPQAPPYQSAGDHSRSPPAEQLLTPVSGNGPALPGPCGMPPGRRQCRTSFSSAATRDLEVMVDLSPARAAPRPDGQRRPPALPRAGAHR